MRAKFEDMTGQQPIRPIQIPKHDHKIRISSSKPSDNEKLDSIKGEQRNK